MDPKAGKALELIVAASLEKCVYRLSRVSAGKWNVGAVRVSCGSMEAAPGAVLEKQ